MTRPYVHFRKEVFDGAAERIDKMLQDFEASLWHGGLFFVSECTITCSLAGAKLLHSSSICGKSFALPIMFPALMSLSRFPTTHKHRGDEGAYSFVFSVRVQIFMIRANFNFNYTLVVHCQEILLLSTCLKVRSQV